jgi:hypothetical protein
MSLKKPKRPRIPYQQKQETVNLKDLVQDYNDIIDKNSKLSSAQRQLVVARIEKLKAAGLVKLQSEINAQAISNFIDEDNKTEDQVAQIIEDNKDPKNIN